MENQLLYKIALSLIPGIGGILARNLIAYTGNIERVFKEKPSTLMKVPGIGTVNARNIYKHDTLKKAHSELNYISRNNISAHFYTDKNYPRRLLNCIDAPILFYSKGNINFDVEKVISIVGTRNATNYGKDICDNLIKSLSERNHKVLIVSGLAYGIDIKAHKSSIKYNLPTVCVLGHGLDLLYPSVHKAAAIKMQENGGMVSDFPSGTKIDPPNFIRRNRIIAGLSDATIVIESGKKGGALITADIATSYNRDVFAFPGRINDNFSSGCNKLIKNNGAALIESIDDLEYLMGWEKDESKRNNIQQKLFVELSDEEQIVFDLLQIEKSLFIDQICDKVNFPMSKVSGLLLTLEFKGAITALPGKVFKIR